MQVNCVLTNRVFVLLEFWGLIKQIFSQFLNIVTVIEASKLCSVLLLKRCGTFFFQNVGLSSISTAYKCVWIRKSSLIISHLILTCFCNMIATLITTAWSSQISLCYRGLFLKTLFFIWKSGFIFTKATIDTTFKCLVRIKKVAYGKNSGKNYPRREGSLF